MQFRTKLRTFVCSGVLGAFFISAAQPVSADSHLPIFDVVPTLGWSLTGDGGDPPVTPGALPHTPSNPTGAFIPGNPEAENGKASINGTATLPLFRNFSISYDKIGNGSFDSLASSFTVPGPAGKPVTVYPGGQTDILQNYRADYHMGHFNIEGGFGSRYRQCCPADYLEWHKGFLGVSYVTPHFDFLNHGFLVLDLTGNAVNHHSSPDVRDALGSLDLPDGELYTTNQSVTAIIPVNLRTGIRTATTYLWGALDFPEHGPFPQYYGVFITSVTKQISNELGLTATIANVQQRQQGYPFPSPAAIRSTSITIAADFHLDFNKIMRTLGRPTQPGVPGAPGGPAPVSPTQGGAVQPSPAPGAPAPSPAP
jgi:hypothetical protein